MATKCQNCGSTRIRDELVGQFCKDCGQEVDDPTQKDLSNLRQETSYLGSDGSLTSAGAFELPDTTFDDAYDLHNDRSELAQKRDEERRARITTDFDKWASDMDSFDFPGVDTPDPNPSAKEKDEPFVDPDFYTGSLF